MFGPGVLQWGDFFQGVGHFFQGDVLIQSIKNGLKVRDGEFFDIGVDLVNGGLGAEKRLE